MMPCPRPKERAACHDFAADKEKEKATCHDFAADKGVLLRAAFIIVPNTRIESDSFSHEVGH